ncbi:lytic murein transglycosylase [Conexibacter woesei]|uniref:Lytic transglycosylase catalytic n=1 Tax=Conexibacter woesei (strain DSM 14684 / CCUG 47730 / CIP 108061 / JCM 11494 / NBRC 100937 / ID131577) TaxID=469383 RepID=D3EZ02_CONWI|nr:lytic murein transglycosylase [Conexibacter woesei]ADB49876.1 Lytic transglycosylase catalytic [Conexibacter woesei DSM 14684]
MADQRPGVNAASAAARAAVSMTRRLARAAATRGASLVLELKLLAIGACVVACVLIALVVLIMILGAKAEALTEGGVTPTCSSSAGSPPSTLMPIYDAAAARYRLGADGWSYLAAINKVETDFGTNLNVSSAGAQGWMQFMPPTWSAYGVDGDDDGDRDPMDPEDAIHGAARYLRASGAPGDWYSALFAYNRADWYVRKVQGHAAAYRDECSTQTYAPGGTTPGTTAKLRSDGTVLAPEEAPEKVKQIIAAANRIANLPYKWGGGHAGWLDSGYDCSGLVSYALWGASLLSGAMVSGGFTSWGDPGPGQWVSIYANSGHVFMVVAGLRLDTGGGDRIGSAWRGPDRTRARSYAGFTVVHPPGL